MSARVCGTSWKRAGRLMRWAVLVLAVLTLIGLGTWWLTRPKLKIDMVAALRANNRGIGHMEQFEYSNAVFAFEETVRLAPDWLPGRINLGIALLNQHTEENLDRAVSLFEQILKENRDNPYAHFCLGILLQHRNKTEEAAGHFEEVTRIDPNDAAAWYRLGSSLPRDSERVVECYRKATQLDPYSSAAIYGLAMELRQHDLEKAKALLAEQEALKKALWDTVTNVRYSEMGRYAAVIDRPPDSSPGPRTGPIPLFAPNDQLQIQLRPGTRWATAADFGTGTVAELRRRIRERFGGVMVVLDYNRDGKLDVLLLGAVVEGGKVRDLLLRNEGDGRFTDVTLEAGLGQPWASIGCCVADFDNDGYPDLFITGIGGQRLLRNTGKGRFEDVTSQAGLETLNTVCLGAAFVDLDQDGDLDLVVAQYAVTAESALASLKSDKPVQGPGLAVYLNIGEAPAAKPTEEPPPLTPRFRRADNPAALLEAGLPVTGLAVSDLDGDHDLDLLVLSDHHAPAMVLNDRLLRFHRAVLPESLVPPAKWNGALVLDAGHRGRSDLFLVRSGQPPLLLHNSLRAVSGSAENSRSQNPVWERGRINSPALLHAQAIDVDLDGWTDVVGLSTERKPVLLHNDGRGLVHISEAFGRDADWPRDLIAVTMADFDGDGFPDLLVWSESTGLQLHMNRGNGNHAAQVELTGHRRVDPRGEPVRCNADGIGAVVIVQAEDHWTSLENTTLSAGLGQSRQPLLLGLGRHAQPDVVRLRWPDNVWQAEFNLPTGQVTRIHETNRKETSCPILFAWDGRRFGFVTDFLGAGSMGEMQTGGGYRPPRPEESVKIEPNQLAPLNGHYVLKVAEPMDEVVYLDRLQLLVVDHPPELRVYPDERFVSAGPPPSQDLLALREPILPIMARDHEGKNVSETLRGWDRRTVDGFAKRTWLGLAEEHWVELDFGDRLAAFSPEDRLILCMAGWTDYAYPESIWAATQAGIRVLPPVLERLGPDGQWHILAEDAGFPAGLPRMMTLEVTGQLCGPRCRVRLRTNLQIYWDQIYIAPLVARISAAAAARGQSSGSFRTTCLEVDSATLATRGCPQEYSPDGRKPTLYDHDRLESVPVSRWSGKLTRPGSVTELLRDLDDRFVIFGPGDDITVRFDARQLPDLPRGWTRSFVLRTWGYCKDSGPFTATGNRVEPLPFRGMSTYPYGPEEEYPRDALHEEYRRRFNTRQVGSETLPRNVRH